MRNITIKTSTLEGALRESAGRIATPSRLPDHLTEILIDNALDAGRDIRPGRAQRVDGWTPGRVRTFLHALSQHGVVADAARAAGISPKSAYALRNSAKGGAFDRAWQAAVAFARRPPAGRVVSSSIGRCVVPIIRNGKIWGELHRCENRLTMATLKRLDRAAAESPQDEALVGMALEHFDAFVEIVCAGAEAGLAAPGAAEPRVQGPSDEA